MSQIRKYGWKPDIPDQRDRVCKMSLRQEQLPPIVDLRSQFTFDPYDQLSLGSCTAQGIGACHQFNQVKQKLDVFNPSKLFIYFNERAMEGTINEDAGAMIRDGIKSVVAQGVCSEDMWSYSDDSIKFRQKPPKDCYDSAIKHQALVYERVDNRIINNIKSVLAQGYPIVCGIALYESFESRKVATTGIVPMPDPNERMIGGHAVVCVGYDDTKQHWIMRNRWGNWGDKGYFYLPYNYLTNPNLADDFWVIKFVEDEDMNTDTTTTMTTTAKRRKKSFFEWLISLFK